MLEQQADFARDFLARDEQVWSNAVHSLSAKMADLGRRTSPRSAADSLKKHADTMSTLARKAQQRGEEALVLHRHFLNVIKEREGGLKRVGG